MLKKFWKNLKIYYENYEKTIRKFVNFLETFENTKRNFWEILKKLRTNFQKIYKKFQKKFKK